MQTQPTPHRGPGPVGEPLCVSGSFPTGQGRHRSPAPEEGSVGLRRPGGVQTSKARSRGCPRPLQGMGWELRAER